MPIGTSWRLVRCNPIFLWWIYNHTSSRNFFPRGIAYFGLLPTGHIPPLLKMSGIFCSFDTQHREPNPVSRWSAPLCVRSKRHSPMDINVLVVLIDSSSSAGCMRIHTIPSILHSVFRKMCLLGSYWDKTGEDVMETFMSWNKVISEGVHVIIGMSERKYFVIKPRKGLILIAK